MEHFDQRRAVDQLTSAVSQQHIVSAWPDAPPEHSIRTFQGSEATTSLEARKSLVTSAMEAADATSSGKGGQVITQIICNNLEPTSEFEYAERMRLDIERISDPGLMVAILRCMQARMAAIKQERQK